MRLVVTLPETNAKTYPVQIEPGVFKQRKFKKKDVIVVTDNTVKKKYATVLAGYQVVSFPAGEKHKQLSTVERLAEQLVKLGANRDTTLIAFGGGVVGDITGFLAAMYMRGIEYYQVPTTLLAMVDASIGGKTGVDMASGKNLLGAFHQPQAVLIDPTWLADLPDEEFINGMGEVIKYGVLDAQLFKWLEQNSQKVNNRDLPTLTKLLTKSARSKVAIVSADEKEKGERMLLNLGHTFGHAIEQLSDYTIPHGEAVGIGLLYAAHYAGWTKQNTQQWQQLQQLLLAFGLPTQLETPYSPKQMVKVMMSDKKNTTGRITLVLPNTIGDVQISSGISPKQVEQSITHYHNAFR